MANNKIVLSSGEVLLDLTGDTVAPEKLKKGVTAHDKSGAAITGTDTADVDTSGMTTNPAEVLDGKPFGAAGKAQVGTMPNNEGVTLDITDADTPVAIPMGFHDGSGKARIAPAEAAKLIPGNIKAGVTILGKEGTYGGEAVKAQANKDVTPSFAQQVVTPDEDYDYLAQVTVAAIPIAYTDNAAGGQTVTIG